MIRKTRKTKDRDMRTFGSEKNYAVWDSQVTGILMQERTTGTSFPINPDEVMPRYLKAAEDQKSRTVSKAEVFTPYELVKKMNDQVLDGFEGSVGDYIKRTVLEVTCGEAPFLTTRYDAATGEEIPIENRTGLLDRKLACIPDSLGKDGYVECATAALKSAYGYEWQYDSLFLARRNLLMTTIEHYENVWKTEPSYETVLNWASIISYNIIRMDGLSMCVPDTDIPAKVMNWEAGKVERFAA